MNYKKYTAVILSALCLTACGNTSSVSEETTISSEITAETTSVISESITEISETTEDDEENSSKPEEKGYKFENYALYIDMSMISDPASLYERLSEDNYIRKVILSNTDNADLSFISENNIYYLKIDKYNGKTDLSVLANSKISTLEFGEVTDSTGLDAIPELLESTSLEFDIYNGNIDFDFFADNKKLNRIILNNVTDVSGLETIAKAPNITYICINNYSQNINLSFLAECPNITTLRLEGTDVKTDMFIDAVKNSSLKKLYIKTENYDIADGEKMILALPDMDVSYCMDDSPWYELSPFEYGYVPESDVMVYTNPCVNIDASEEKWECTINELKYDYSSISEKFEHKSSLLCTFTNNSNDVKTVNSARLYRIYDGEETITFSNESEILNINLELEPQTMTEFDITDDMLLYTALQSGEYKIVFNVGEEETEHKFYVFSEKEKSPYFLTDEQSEIYEKAKALTETYFWYSHNMSEEYIQNTTAEEFISMVSESFTYDTAVSLASSYMDENGELIFILADRGTDITYFDNFFKSIYADENTVIFQTIVVHTDDGTPYFVWFETLNYKMVNTENGWRVERFSLWN